MSFEHFDGQEERGRRWIPLNQAVHMARSATLPNCGILVSVHRTSSATLPNCGILVGAHTCRSLKQSFCAHSLMEVRFRFGFVSPALLFS
jgi:hypothetical protein